MKFGFGIEGRTSFAMDILAENLNQISIERINAEISKTLSYLCDKPLHNFDEEEYNKHCALYLRMIKYLHIVNYKINDWQWDYSVYPARKLLTKIKYSNYHDIINFAKSLCDDENDNRQRRIFLSLNTLQSEVAQCINNCDVYSLKYLAINGNDLIELGYNGKQIGKILNELLDLVMRDRVKNIRAELIQIIKDGKLNAGI